MSVLTLSSMLKRSQMMEILPISASHDNGVRYLPLNIIKKVGSLDSKEDIKLIPQSHLWPRLDSGFSDRIFRSSALPQKMPLTFKILRIRTFLSILMASVGFEASTIASQSDIPADQLEYFEKRIRPIFAEICIECHGPEKQKGGLRLDSRDGWVIGGDSGPALVPGDLENSRLIHAIRYDDADFQMPPKSKLTPQQIANLEEWISFGAPDPRRGPTDRLVRKTIDIEDGREFWSFQPIKTPTPPRKTVSPSDTIDAFLESKLDEAGLQPEERATSEALVRRAYFALIGLPPSIEQIDAFLNDTRPNAFEHLIDELLASHHFGERWGRHWLDVARFAESSGGGRTLLFKDAWRYRDYVIESFNADQPFDQMIREQLAGDLLPRESVPERSRQLTATAFLALGPTNYEQQDKQLLRYDIIDEQIDTVGKAFLGMTLGCARCHDHKFDPIPTADYYALAGIFKSTRTLYNYTDNVARWNQTPLPLEGEESDSLTEIENQATTLKSERAMQQASLKLIAPPKKAPPKPGKPAGASLFPGIVIDDQAGERLGEWNFSQYSQNYLGEGYVHDGNERKGEKHLVFKPLIPQDGTYEVRIAYSANENRSSVTPVTIRHADGETTVLVDQRQEPSIFGRFQSIGSFEFKKGTDYPVRIETKNTDGYVVVDGMQWVLTPSSMPDDAKKDDLIASLVTSIDRLNKQLKPLESRLKSRPVAMTVHDDPNPSNSAIRIRGVESRKGNMVSRGFLQVVSGTDTPSIPDNRSGRQELADWIASPSNPLTARVAANRVWTWLFGSGIVATVDNFGTTGSEPSHPELLDFLASRFIQNGWSFKSLIKEIMLTEAWQRSTPRNSENIDRDPSNKLLAAYPKRRLDAEQLRDAILAVNGNLDVAFLGPNIKGAGEINANSTAAQKIEYNYVFEDTRRSVYTPAFRVQRHELFELFDFGNVNFTIGQRNTSTVALQALYLLNNPFVIEQSRLAAKRLLAETSDPDSRIINAYRSVLGRLPSDGEHALIQSYLKDGQNTDPVDTWTTVFQSLFGSIDFRYLN